MPLDFHKRAEMTRDIQKHGYSVCRAISPQVDRSTGAKAAGLEHDISTELKREAEESGRPVRGVMVPFTALTGQRDLTTTSTSGGELVGTDHLNDQFVDLLRPTSAVVAAGATVLSGLKGNVSIPKVSAGASGAWVAEGGAPSETTHTTTSITLSPKHLAAYTEVGRTLVIQSSPAVDAWVGGDLRKALGTSLDAGAINGSGTSNEPTGILNQSGIGAVAMGTNGAIPDWDSLVDLIQEVAIDDALNGRLGFLTNSKVVAKLRKTAKVSSTDSVMIMEKTGALLGYPLFESSNVPSNLTKGSGTDLSACLFSNFADLIIGSWGSGIDLLVDPYADSTKGLIRISAFLDCDVQIKHAESFASVQDLITA
jgi:HK97 family phage major capsid protein